MKANETRIKTWLAAHPERDRKWLAGKCGVEKKTVDNWLSTARNIPSKAIVIIEALMREDEGDSIQSASEAMTLPITCSSQQLSLYSRAFKKSECDALGQWITTRLDAAASKELAAEPGQDKICKTNMNP